MRKLRRRMWVHLQKFMEILPFAISRSIREESAITINFRLRHQWKESPSPATHSRLPRCIYINTTDTRKICIKLGRRGAGRKQRNNKIEINTSGPSWALTVVCIKYTTLVLVILVIVAFRFFYLKIATTT